MLHADRRIARRRCTAAILTDGPYCGSGDNQFDADLLRVRKVRVTLRMQAAIAGAARHRARRCS